MPPHLRFYERHNFFFIPTVFRDIYDKVEVQVLDEDWHLVDNGLGDLATTV
ncbi:hypothetical protein BPUTSESOX_1531 [uncultured Gammaproteobacteria bacterium]|nr:hypothetical protein [uncultured Gammaproteobacteria bacterium]VVH51560.1 hypothetical protein BPUTSESOX_1531 [uncultured Gammaproteobacteria bacterium]